MDDIEIEARPQARTDPSAPQPCPLGEAIAVLDTLPVAVAIMDTNGDLRAANRAWLQLADKGAGLGALQVGDNVLRASPKVPPDVLTGIVDVAAGRRAEFVRTDLRCAAHQDRAQDRWFDLTARAMDPARGGGVLVSLDDVSDRHRALATLRESDARHRHAERIARLGHWRLVHAPNDWKHGSIEYSPQALSILGMPPGAKTHTFEDMQKRIHPDDLATVMAIYERDVDSYEIEYRIIRPDGIQLTIRETGERIESPETGIVLEFGTLQDVSEQRRSADRLHELNDELEHLVAQRTAALVERESLLARAQSLAKIGHYTWQKSEEPAGSIGWHKGLHYSEAAASIFGVMPEALAVPDEVYVARFVHPDDRTHVLHAYRFLYQERIFSRAPLEYRIVRPDGSVRHVIETIERILGDGREVEQALGLIQDITSRKVAELARRESEARLSAFMDNAPFIMSIKDLDGRLQMINREGAESYEAPEESLRGHKTEELMPDDSGRAITHMSREVVATGAAVKAEIELPGRKRYHWSLEIEFPIRDADGYMTAIGGFAVDITEQKKAELALRDSETRLRAIFDNVPITLSLCDPEGRYTMVNQRFLERVRKTEAEVLGHTAIEVFGAEAGRKLEDRKLEVMRSVKPITYESRTPLDVGARDCAFTHFPILDNGAIKAVGTIALDLTEQRAAEAALQQAQKMELVGQLTGGMAHDFNNLLGAIIGNLDLLATKVGDQPPAAELVNRALSAAERGVALIQRLLAFSRRQTLSPRLIDVNQLIQGMRSLLEHSLGGGLSLSIRTGAESPYCRVDPVQLEAAMLNLAVNARDAMPAGGKLTIETANVTMAIDPANPEPIPYVMIVVADNGTGMPREVLVHVFEPFFTTKPVGKGSGLGLSMVHGFVKQSGGHIEIDSQVGRGTTVGLFLPCADPNAEDDELDEPAEVAEVRRGHGEKILIVEDDPEVMAYGQAALEQLGYACVAAGDGEEAIRCITEHPDIALVFSDVLLPGKMNGPALIVAARRLRPDIKVLFTSGYEGGEEGKAQAALRNADLFLAKPYRISDLSQIIADILADPQP